MELEIIDKDIGRYTQIKKGLKGYAKLHQSNKRYEDLYDPKYNIVSRDFKAYQTI